MAVPEDGIELAREFAKAVIRRRWAELLPLLSSTLRAQRTADSIGAEFGWKHLLPRLKQMHSDQTGEDVSTCPDIDPPKRFEEFEMVEGQREPPSNLDPSIPFGWVEVNFYPSEDSEWDNCYNCFLAVVDEGGPRVAAYAIESATE
jgi:hypothetical protein